MYSRLFFSLLLFGLFFSCSPLKRYSEENYAWALQEIEHFKVLNKQAAPENALLFLGSSSIRLWSTLAEDMAPIQ